jgi:ferritin-like metal-binding protein YciE
MPESEVHPEFVPKELEAFYFAEQQLMRALQLMGEAASHVTNPIETRKNIARLQRAFQALLASATGGTTEHGAIDGKSGSDQIWETSVQKNSAHPLSPALIQQYEKAALDSVESFAKSLGQPAVVEMLEETSAQKQRRARKPTSWPGPLRKRGQ